MRLGLRLLAPALNSNTQTDHGFGVLIIGISIARLCPADFVIFRLEPRRSGWGPGERWLPCR
jgi:hypothetical protein